jgi:hypothetical protein
MSHEDEEREREREGEGNGVEKKEMGSLSK